MYYRREYYGVTVNDVIDWLMKNIKCDKKHANNLGKEVRICHLNYLRTMTNEIFIFDLLFINWILLVIEGRVHPSSHSPPSRILHCGFSDFLWNL